MSSGKGKCNPCRNHNCPKCGTTHAMYECVLFEKDGNNMNEKDKCVVIETDIAKNFEEAMNKFLNEGYKVISSSCNSRLYKAILVLDEE